MHIPVPGHHHEQMVQIVKDRWKNPDFIIRLSDSNRNGKSLIEESTEISRLNQRLYTHSRIVETSQDPIRVSRSLLILEHLLNKFSKLQQETV